MENSLGETLDKASALATKLTKQCEIHSYILKSRNTSSFSTMELQPYVKDSLFLPIGGLSLSRDFLL